MMPNMTMLFALVLLLIGGASVGASAQVQQSQSAAPGVETRRSHDPGLPAVTFEEIVGQPKSSAGYSLAAISAGAVAGVVAFNLLLPVLGYTTVSAALAAAPITGATLESALATSRVFAVGSAVAGGLAGHWLYSGPSR